MELDYVLLGSRLRAVRKKQGLTQEQVSEKAGISAQHYSGIETGSAKVSLPALVRLCNSLSTTPNEILMDSVEESTPLHLKDVADLLEDCSAAERYVILTQAKNLKQVLRQMKLLN